VRFRSDIVVDPQLLQGRTVLLTGASGGIGSATAGALLAQGATVLAHYCEHRAAAEAALAGAAAGRGHLVPGDLATAEGARALWHAGEALGPVDVLVLNAAVIPPSPLNGSDAEWDAGWQEALQVNVLGAGALLREATRAFAGRGAGTAIVLSSWAAEQGSRLVDVSAYAASKAAIRNLAQTLARHYARDGVRVHIIAPGVVDVGMGVAGHDVADTRAVANGLAMGRHVAAAEVAAVVSFLTSDAAPSLTGATIDLNGASYIR